eukprot:5580721-Prymnesium_polylepis.1
MGNQAIGHSGAIRGTQGRRACGMSIDGTQAITQSRNQAIEQSSNRAIEQSSHEGRRACGMRASRGASWA